MDKRKYIFNWNHISEKLTPREVEELKAYYKTYHKKGIQTSNETLQKIEINW